MQFLDFLLINGWVGQLMQCLVTPFDPINFQQPNDVVAVQRNRRLDYSDYFCEQEKRKQKVIRTSSFSFLLSLVHEQTTFSNRIFKKNYQNVQLDVAIHN